MAVIDTTAPFPEHEKLKLVADKSQVIGEFVGWLETKGIWLESNARRTPAITQLLAEFFEIDLDVIETEKRAMLDLIRDANEA